MSLQTELPYYANFRVQATQYCTLRSSRNLSSSLKKHENPLYFTASFNLQAISTLLDSYNLRKTYSDYLGLV